MTSAEELLGWVRTPLDDLKRDVNEQPDKPWTTRRTELLARLGLREPTEYPMIGELFERLDQMTNDDRTKAIKSGELDSVASELAKRHGVAQPTNQEQTPPGPAYDEAIWQTYLAENGPTWDGTEQTWAQFTQWFLYYAGERGVTEPATALIGYLSSQSAAERITTLAQYGVVIAPPAVAAQPAPGVDMDTTMADILAENPRLAAIPEERRRELLAEVFGDDRS